MTHTAHCIRSDGEWLCAAGCTHDADEARRSRHIDNVGDLDVELCFDWVAEAGGSIETLNGVLAKARAAGAAEERARIVAMMRRKAKVYDSAISSKHWAVGVAIEALADRIERGAP